MASSASRRVLLAVRSKSTYAHSVDVAQTANRLQTGVTDIELRNYDAAFRVVDEDDLSVMGTSGYQQSESRKAESRRLTRQPWPRSPASW